MLFLTNTAAAPAMLELGIGEIFSRLLCAMTVGMVIGTEREYTNRPAGMRTHILVALGAAAVMITGQLIFAQYHAYGASSDPARLSAQVITGVGFLGAGTILREGTHVKGLTTAASLWAVACLGISAGGGYYTVALVGMGFIFVTLTIFEVLQHKLIGSHGSAMEYTAEVSDIAAGLDTIGLCARQYCCSVRSIAAKQTDEGFCITFLGEFTGIKAKKRRRKFFEALVKDAAMTTVRVSEGRVGAK